MKRNICKIQTYSEVFLSSLGKATFCHTKKHTIRLFYLHIYTALSLSLVEFSWLTYIFCNVHLF